MRYKRSSVNFFDKYIIKNVVFTEEVNGGYKVYCVDNFKNKNIEFIFKVIKIKNKIRIINKKNNIYNSDLLKKL